MKTLYLACAVAMYSGAPAFADEEMPKACVALAMKIGSETGSQYVRTSRLSVFFRPPLPKTSFLDNELTIGCEYYLTDPKDWSVFVSWAQNSSPPLRYYEIVAQAGAILTGEKKDILAKAAKTCVRTALGQKSELDDELTSKAKIECQAFARDGGSVSVSVFTRKEGDEKSDWSD